MYNKLLAIAQKHTNCKTFHIFKSDQRDFHDIASWQLKQALIDAYKLGQQNPNVKLGDTHV